MYRFISPILIGLMISAAHALFEQAGPYSARLPIMLHLMLGGIVIICGRGTMLRACYAALSVGLFVCAVLVSGDRLSLWPTGTLGVGQFESALAWAPWTAAAGSVILACIALGQATRRHQSQQPDAVRMAQASAPARLNVRPGSQRMLRPEDRRIVRRQRRLEDEGGVQ